jgi:hypothetical protein
MNGRWTINGTGTHDAEFGVTGRSRPYVEGPWLDPGVSVPVVPCDAAAVERVAVLLFARSFVPMQTADQVQRLWDAMDDDQREFTREAAREFFRTAGEMP